uniref:PDZ domain-containing protein n=1 Tax=Triticum urartu TaxID=4572 RepID=A0A8R7UAS1_TRIUA
MFNGCRRGPFVPSSVLNGCMDLWRNFGCILRPHLGLQFEAIKFLDPTRGEYIWRKLNIDDGLVVEEMSAGSHAEKIGIRVGDIIDCINGERISTTLELENKLLSICMGNFNRGNLEVDVSVSLNFCLKSCFAGSVPSICSYKMFLCKIFVLKKIVS